MILAFRNSLTSTPIFVDRWFRFVLLGVLTLVTAACATTKGDSPDQKRAAVQSMSQQVLADLYIRKQSARAEIQAAPGYAVFSNANVNVIFAGFGGGYGLVHDNRTRQDTYMRMGEIGLGFGAGVKDYRLVFVFHDEKAMNRFVKSGWVFGGQADAAAKAGDKGGAVGGEAVFDGVSVYQLTESGLALQATLTGAKYWVDKTLSPQVAASS